MLYSHKFDDGTKIELKKHLQDVTNVSLGIIHSKILNFSLPSKIIEEISFIISTCHDFGKSTRFFQEDRLVNNIKNSYTNHALLSAMAGFVVSKDYVETCIKNLSNGWDSFIPLMVFYIIAHHHITLEDLSDSIVKPENEKQIFKEQIDKINDAEVVDCVFTYNGFNIEFSKIKERLSNWIQNSTEDELHEQFYSADNLTIQHIFLLYFLFSILMEADKSRLILDKEDKQDFLNIDSRVVDEYKQDQIFKGNAKIKELREKAYKEITGVVSAIDLNHKIYSITLPTGLGKTLTSLSFALKLRERISSSPNGFLPKIIYSLPFLSIIDQTEKVFNDVFKKLIDKHGNKVLLKDHSLTDIAYKTDTEQLDTNKSEFLISTWNAEVILTTVDRLFYSFFSPAREYIMRFHNLFNSVIILDEIQSINDEIWLTIKDFFSCLSKIGNSYIILMTATQPVVFDDKEIVEIVSNPESYFKELNRIKICSYLEKEKAINLNEFINIVSNYIKDNPKKDVMVVLNTVDSSVLVCEEIKKRYKQRNPIYLSSSIIPKERLKRINKINTINKKGKVIVTTQCIEAGVDIDVDVVFRDFAPLDSINQVAGRCNRHWLRDLGEVFIYRIIDDSSTKQREYYSYIYGDVHTKKTTEVLKNGVIAESEIFSLNQDYFKKLKEWHFETKEIIDKMLKCEFSNTRKFSKILRGDDFLKESVFVNLNKESQKALDGYLDAIQTKNWKERRNKLLEIRKNLAENTISLYKVGKRKREQYILNNYIDNQFGLSCLDKEHYDKDVGFSPKNKPLIL